MGMICAIAIFCQPEMRMLLFSLTLVSFPYAGPDASGEPFAQGSRWTGVVIRSGSALGFR
jgi:hypothetical protein